MPILFLLVCLCPQEEDPLGLSRYSHLLVGLPNAESARPDRPTLGNSWPGWAGFGEGSWIRRGHEKITLKRRLADRLELEVYKHHPSWRKPVVRTQIVRRPAPPPTQDRPLQMGGRTTPCLYATTVEECGHSTKIVTEVWFRKAEPSFLVRSLEKTDNATSWDYRIVKWDAVQTIDGRAIPACVAKAKGWDGRRWVEVEYRFHSKTGILLNAKKLFRRSPRKDDRRVYHFDRERTVHRIVAGDSKLTLGKKQVSFLLVEQFGDFAFERSPAPGWKPNRTWYSADVPGGVARRETAIRTSNGVRIVEWAVDEFHAVRK